MTISKETESAILRYHFVEQWGVHTIAKQLGVHHSTVDRVLSQAGLPKSERAGRPSIIDPYLPFIVKTLEQFPKLTAARLYAMAQERGYTGGPSHFRQRIAQLRPKPQPEAYLRLKTLPGEQAQVDWGHFDYVQVGRAKRPLMAFVMVLSWSRRIFLRFYLNQRMENFIRGHVAAFHSWKGIPKVLLYDNLKSAVLERQGEAIRFHPTLLALSAHYCFEPRPVAVARGNEKGRVERSIRYIRDNFFAARSWRDVDDLNAQAQAWYEGPASQRRCPDQTESVQNAFEREQSALIQLPDDAFTQEERVEVSVGKTPYARFDLNDYSVPHIHVRKSLTLLASEHQIRVLDGEQVIATHRRSYDKGAQIEDEAHVAALKQQKQQARLHAGQHRLLNAAPSSNALLELAAERGQSIKALVKHLIQLLDEYGAQSLETGISEALAHQIPDANAVRQVLQRHREQRQQPPPIAVALQHDKARDIAIAPASLSPYDQLGQEVDDE